MIFFICLLSATQESDLIPLTNTTYYIKLKDTNKEISSINIPIQSCDLENDTCNANSLRSVKKTPSFKNVFCGDIARDVYYGFLSLLFLISLVFIAMGIIYREKYYFTMFGMFLWPLIALLTWVVNKYYYKE